LGGTLGGFVGWMVSEDFKSVPQVLMELPATEKQKLCAEAMAVVKHLDWNDAAQLTKLVLSNSIIKDKIVGVLSTYIKNKLKGKLMYKE
ncbi:CS012 protein, partial [Spizella passerina]|nr:CS012 protein [Spizella passerina]